MFVIYYLIAMCVFAGVNACLLSCLYRRPLNSYFTAVFFSIVLAEFGHLFLSPGHSHFVFVGITTNPSVHGKFLFDFSLCFAMFFSCVIDKLPSRS